MAYCRGLSHAAGLCGQGCSRRRYSAFAQRPDVEGVSQGTDAVLGRGEALGAMKVRSREIGPALTRDGLQTWCAPVCARGVRGGGRI